MPTYIGYASGTAATISDTAWDQRAKMLLLIGGGSGGGGTPPLGAAPEIYQNIWDDPNGHVIPNKPAFPARYSQLVSAGASPDAQEWHWQPDTGLWK